MARLTIIMDIDGTICPIKEKAANYEDLKPYQTVLDKLNEYREKGAYIILYTSRNMKTHKGNIGLINVKTAKILLEWLEKWEVPYDEIIYAKPWPGENGFYVDDRSIRPDEFIKYSVDELNMLIDESRKEL